MARKKKAEKEKKPVTELSKRQELNNHIVCMRNTVAQVRVQIINRLVHQVKKYKNRKGDDKEQEKARRKVERLIEEIQTLKKVKKDKASLYALQDTKPQGSVLNDPSSCVEERVLSRISHHNLIKAKVLIYRNANPNWDKQIPVLLRMTQQKRKKKDGSEDKSTEEKNLSLNSSKQSESSEDDSGESDNEDYSEKHTVLQPKLSRPVKTIAKTESANEKQEINSSGDKDSTENVQKRDLNKVQGAVVVKLLKDLNDIEVDDITKDTQPENVFPNITQPVQKRKPKSGFFVGGVDEPEDKSPNLIDRNTRAPKSNFNSDNNSSQSKGVFRKGKLISKGPSANHQKAAHSSFDRNNRFNRDSGFSEPMHSKPSKFSSSEFNKGINGSNQSVTDFNQVASNSTEKLHPSWEAKKKQQQITEFVGKRVVFDDDD